MAKVEIYTRPLCGFTNRALALLDAKGVDYINIPAGMDVEKRAEMVDRSGRATFPQIFIGGKHIGGYDDIKALDDAGKLDALLTA